MKMHTLICFVLFCLVNNVLSYAQTLQYEKYSLVNISMCDKKPVDLAKIGIGLDHFNFHQHEKTLAAYLSEHELELLEAANYQYEVIIPDVTEHFQKTNGKETTAAKRNDIACEDDLPAYNVPSGFDLGSMGGYFTYQEMLDHLDALAVLYPNLISLRQPISSELTYEDRSIYYVKISDNVNQNEDEPEMLYTALHHAREPMTLSQMLFYIYYLLENYDDNEEVQSIVNNTQLYFVPCLNPDGYIYNETTAPNGGGMWRKNRRDNGDGTWGVDLNRNYGYNWGHDDVGSSPDPSTNTYRGTEGFSEPETSAIRQFCAAHHFIFAINYHSFSEVLIMPWGYVNELLPEKDYYTSIIQDITETSRYNYGTCNEMLNYSVNGSSDDWMYGEQNEKEKIYAFTVEVGTEFWQSSPTIVPTCLEAMPFNLKTAKMLLNYANVKDISSYLIGSTTHQLSLDITRLGKEENGTFTISCLPISNEILSVSEPIVLSNLPLNQTIRDTITLQIDPAALNNNADIYYIVQVNNGLLTTSDTVHRRAGHWELVLSDTFNSNNTWSTTTGNIQAMSPDDISTEDCPTPPNCFHATILPEKWLAPVTVLDLTDVQEAYAQCQMKWDITTRFNSFWWTPVEGQFFDGIKTCGLYSKIGNDYMYDFPVYDGEQRDWILETLDLSNALGSEVRLSFMTHGFSSPTDHLSLDDLSVWVRGTSPTSTSNIASASTISVYPNPADTHITIDLSGQIKEIDPNNQLHIALSDVTGRVINSFVVNHHQFAGNCRFRLPLNDVPNGVYILTINQNANVKYSRKIFVSHLN